MGLDQGMESRQLFTMRRINFRKKRLFRNTEIILYSLLGLDTWDHCKAPLDVRCLG